MRSSARTRDSRRQASLLDRPGTIAIVFAACLLLMLSGEAQAASHQEADSAFGFGLSYLSGNTLYHISAYDAAGSGIESELEFPLRTLMLGLEGGYIGRDDKGREQLRISLQWFTNFDNGSGKMKDSDWITSDLDSLPPPDGVGAPHPGLDIYSESDIALTANIVDLRASYTYWRSEGFAIGPLGGILYQNFQFDASNVNQVGYGPYAPAYTGSVSGLVLTYEVTYTVPYIGIHSQLIAGAGFEMALDLGYSPWAAAEDRDDHVLRQKIAKASTSGTAWLAALTAQWDIKANDFFLIRGQVLEIDTSGTQTQTFYDGSGLVFTGINDKITSQQASASFLFSHRF